MSLARRAALLSSAAVLAGCMTPAHALIGTTTAHKFDSGGDSLPAVEVTLASQPLSAVFTCKAVSTVTDAYQTRAKCELFQSNVLVASADSGYVTGSAATADGFYLGSGIFLTACVTGYSKYGDNQTATNHACADVLLS
jgi:hypothetical protein